MAKAKKIKREIDIEKILGTDMIRCISVYNLMQLIANNKNTYVKQGIDNVKIGYRGEFSFKFSYVEHDYQETFYAKGNMFYGIYEFLREGEESRFTSL